MAWNGARVGKIGGGGLYNGYATPKAKQAWEVGDVVNVGFVRDLEVVKRVRGASVLWQADKNRFYSFVPHMGLARHETLAEALREVA